MENNRTTPKILLRAMEPADIDAIYRWENDPAVWKVSAAHQPFSRDALSRFIDECSGSDIYATRQLRLMAESDGNAVGCVDLFDFDPYHLRAGLGIIVDSRLRRQGLGYAMLTALHDFAAENLRIHQLYCDIAADNTQCINLFTRFGYRQCGTMNQWVWNGSEWIDAFRFQMIIEKQDR